MSPFLLQYYNYIICSLSASQLLAWNCVTFTPLVHLIVLTAACYSASGYCCDISGSDVFLYRLTGLHILLCACPMALHQTITTTAELPATRYSDIVITLGFLCHCQSWSNWLTGCAYSNNFFSVISQDSVWRQYGMYHH